MRNKIKNNPTKVLKIPQGAYIIANQNNILPDMLFYLLLKSINTEGYFKRGHVIPSIQRIVKFSQSHIRIKLNRLEKLKLLRKNKGNISLVCYDKLFLLLGYDLTNKKDLKLFRIPLEKISIDIIEEYIQTLEIKRNLKNQEKTALSKYIRNTLNHSDTAAIPSKLIKLIKRHHNNGALYKSQLRTIRKNGSIEINHDITLTCKAVSKLLGFKSASKGYEIEKRLGALNFLQIQSRTLFIASEITKDMFKVLYLDSSYFLKGNKLFKRLPNLLTVKI